MALGSIIGTAITGKMLGIASAVLFGVAALAVGYHFYATNVSYRDGHAAGVTAGKGECIAAQLKANEDIRIAAEAKQKELLDAIGLHNSLLAAEEQAHDTKYNTILTRLARYAPTKPLDPGCFADAERMRAVNSARSPETGSD